MELISLRPLWWLLLLPMLWLGWRYSLVDAPMWKRAGSFGCRVLGILCLILALCRPFAFSTSDSLHVVFLVDVSQSIDLGASSSAADEIQKAIDELRRDDSWTLFAIGNDLRNFESPEALKTQLESWSKQGSDDAFRSATRLADSLLMSRLSFPAGKVKRVVLFSDGQDTAGFLSDAIRQMASEDVDVRFQKIDALAESEAAVVSLKPSSTRAYYGEVVRMAVNVSANDAISGRLRIVHKGVSIQEQGVELKANQPNRFYFDIDMNTPGDSKWTAELIADKDYFPINNLRTCTITVRGKPRILVLHETEKEMRAFERAMSEQDVVLEVRGKFGLPDSIQGMLAFDAIVLADFPATSMTPRQMSLLNRYVKDFGGGLAMLGSENSFGLGGYHRTPVEEVLPLVSRFEKEKEKPSLAMVLVIDKSGSMDGLPIALARQAAKSAVELLGPRDKIGVVGFDGSPTVISEMRSALESDAICGAIDSLDAGGGTNMYPGMVVGKEMLENTSAKIRHMICLSDGHTQDADHGGLVQAMIDSGITVSTVALGDADRNLLATIAEIGRGRYYETNDPANVPQIFTKETMQASKSAIKEDLYGTVQTGDNRAMAGFVEADLPFTLGYVMTQQKPTAQVLLVAETGDPLLAVSRFGLGTGLAYTSDLSERWGGEWLAWGDVGKFWGQVLRSIARKNDDEGIQISQVVAKGNWELDIKRTDSSGLPQSKVKWQLSALDGQGAMEKVEVKEIGLGRYQASIPVKQHSNLTVSLRDSAGDKTKVLHYDRPYPLEYGLSNKLTPEIEQLAKFSADEMHEGLVPQPTRRSIAPWFYIAAFISLLIGNLIRRL